MSIVDIKDGFRSDDFHLYIDYYDTTGRLVYGSDSKQAYYFTNEGGKEKEYNKKIEESEENSLIKLINEKGFFNINADFIGPKAILLSIRIDGREHS